MPQVVVAQRMWQRRDTAANWTSVNPILADGEIGIERDVPTTYVRIKIGDGTTVWTDLDYFGADFAMRVDGGFIQYSVDEGATWVDVIAVTDLQGVDYPAVMARISMRF